MKKWCIFLPKIQLFFLFILVLSASPLKADPVTLRELTTADKLCQRCSVGDYLISNGKLEFIVGASHRSGESFYKFPTADAFGSLISIKPVGSNINGDVMLGTPYLRINNTTQHILYDEINILKEGDNIIIVTNASYDDKQGTKLNFVGQYIFEANLEKLNLSLTVSNAGTHTEEDLIYALFFDPYQMYYFSPGELEEHQNLQFYAYPRENHLFVWVDSTPRKSRYSDFNFGWDGGMIIPDPIAINLLPEEKETRQFNLFSGDQINDVMTNLYKQAAIASQAVTLNFNSASNKAFEVIVRDRNSKAIFFRSFLDSLKPLSIQLPLGDYIVQGNFFPGVATCSLSVSEQTDNTCALQDPPQGFVDVKIINSAGDNVPGKVSFNGISPNLTPYLKSANPTKDDGYWESYRNSVFPLDKSKLVNLPIGDYLVSATAGPVRRRMI